MLTYRVAFVCDAMSAHCYIRWIPLNSEASEAASISAPSTADDAPVTTGSAKPADNSNTNSSSATTGRKQSNSGGLSNIGRAKRAQQSGSGIGGLCDKPFSLQTGDVVAFFVATEETKHVALTRPEDEAARAWYKNKRREDKALKNANRAKAAGGAAGGKHQVTCTCTYTALYSHLTQLDALDLHARA